MTTPETEVSQDVGYNEDSAAAALLAKWQEPEQTTPEEPVETEAQADQSDEEPTEEVSEDTDSGESGDVEIDVAGEKFKLPAELAEHAKRIEAKAKEVEAGATRKFQEASEIRKAAESQFKNLQELQQIAQQQADLLADHKLVTNRLSQLEQVNVQQLAENDPVTLTRLNAEFNQLMAAKQRIEAAYQERLQQSQQHQQQFQAEKLARLEQFAQKNVKGWNQEYSERLMEFAVKEIGYAPDQLRANVDEQMIRLIDLAYQGHKVRTADPKAKLQAGSKTIRSGSQTQIKTNAAVQADKAMGRLKSRGTVEDAAMALLARSSVKKR